MMEQEWQAQCAELRGEPASTAANLSLAKPRSRCPDCGHQITSMENIPVLSYLLLKGKCAGCGTSISARYPIIEVFTAVLSAYAAWHFGPKLQTVGALLLLWFLIALAAIDFDTQLLPDAITLPLLWLGLVFNLMDTYVDLTRSSRGCDGWLSRVMDSVLAIQASDRQGRHGLWRLQALGGTGCLAWLANVTNHHSPFVSRWRRRRYYADCCGPARP
jgi:prepilin signal peptidase PulO-like enzyme (type II secretory pathway)